MTTLRPAAPDPFGPETTRDPYPAYARLRDEAPVHERHLPGGGSLWVVTRHEDVEIALHHPALSKRFPDVGDFPPPMDRVMGSQLLAQDPPDHTRLRRLVSRAFTPRLVAGLEPRVQHIADTLLDRVLLHGWMDLIDDYAYPLPLTVIAELLGIPAADREPFRRWSAAAVAGSAGEPVSAARSAAMIEFVDYLHELFARKRAEPGNELVSGLVQAQDGDVLSPDELLAMVWLLIVAGHETTVNLIGNGMFALLRHPRQLAELRADPSLLPGAIEEMLRYDGPVETSTYRFSTAAVDLPGGTIPPGRQVLLVLGSADRDERRFADADTFDIHRADTAHLAFGKGIHYCLGAPLARMEGRIAIGTLLRTFPRLRPAVRLDGLEWRPGQLMRGLRSLPVVF